MELNTWLHALMLDLGIGLEKWLKGDQFGESSLVIGIVDMVWRGTQVTVSLSETRVGPISCM